MNKNVKKYLIITSSVFIASILDFLTIVFFQDILHTPLFFDTIFMIAILFIYGPVPALFEYIIFIKFACIKLTLIYGSNDNIYFYTLSALTIIFVTWLFIRKKENLNKGINFTFIYILSAALCAGLACSVVSEIISRFTVELKAKDWDFDKIMHAYDDEKQIFLTAAFIGRIPVTVLDRVITTFAGFGIYKLYEKLKYRKMCQR